MLHYVFYHLKNKFYFSSMAFSELEDDDEYMGNGSNESLFVVYCEELESQKEKLRLLDIKRKLQRGEIVLQYYYDEILKAR